MIRNYGAKGESDCRHSRNSKELHLIFKTRDGKRFAEKGKTVRYIVGASDISGIPSSLAIRNSRKKDLKRVILRTL